MSNYNPFQELKKELNTKKEYINDIIDLSKKTRIKSNNPQKTNIISSNFRDLQIYGTIPEEELSNLNNDTYITQFELKKYDNDKKPVSIYETNKNNLNVEKTIEINGNYSPFSNDTNMTYGISNDLTHNNMEVFNSWRDKQVDNLNCDNNQVIIDRYSGSSRYYFQKKEIEHFFDPKDSKNERINPNLVNDMDRTRYIASYMKQGEKPFDPVQVNKGLNLDYNELGKGGLNDDYRPEYKNVDDLRPLNKPKLSYTGFQNEGKKGQKGSVMAPLNKYRPVTFREIKPDEYVPNANSTTKPYNNPNYQLKEQSRVCDTIEMGNPNRVYDTTNENIMGKSNDFDRKLNNLEQSGNIINNNKFNPNNNSYTIYNNQRNLSKQELNSFVNITSTTYANLSPDIKDTLRNILSDIPLNTNITPIQKQTISNLNDEAKQTLKQLLVLNELNTNIKNNNGTYSNLTDIAKNTIKETLTTQQFNNNITTNQTTYSNITDELKNNMRQLLTNIPINNNINTYKTIYSNLSDVLQPTLKEKTNTPFNTNISNVNTNYANLTDELDITNRQTLSDKQFNTFIKNTLSSYSNLTDDVKDTMRNILTTQPLNTFINSYNKQNISNLSDKAKETLRGLTSLNELNTNIKNINNQNYINLDTNCKETLREMLSLLEFNNNISNHTTTYTNMTDTPKETLKELYTNVEFNNNINNHNQNYANILDTPRETLKELYTTTTFDNNISNKNTNYSNLLDNPRETLKELFTNTEFNNNMNNKNTNYSNLLDNPRETLKELFTNTEFNNNIGNKNTNYSNLTDKAKETLKELYTNVEFNSNIGSINTIYANLSDEIRETLKQLTIIKDYLYLSGNKNGLYNNTFENPDINLRNLINIDYNGPIGFNIESVKRLENVILNELKTYKGRTFNPVGPVINNDKPGEIITLKENINHSRFENGLLKGNNLNDRNYLNSIQLKNYNDLDEKYNNLSITDYDILKNNPLINSLNIKSNNLDDKTTNEFMKNILGVKYNNIDN